jgi:orotate phosphoribosyltransferase
VDAPWSAVQYVQEHYGMSVLSIATLADLLHYLQNQEDPKLAQFLGPVQAYRARYGV